MPATAPPQKPNAAPERHGQPAPSGDRMMMPVFDLEGRSAPAPRKPPDDRAAFELLATVAGQIGRADLVEEFRGRANRVAVPPAPPPQPPAPVPPAVAEGMRLLREGKLDEAVDRLRAACAEHPDEHSAHGNLGVALARLKRFAEAEVCFRESIRIRPESAGMYGNAGAACLDGGKPDEAEICFREGLRRDPARADYHRHLGGIAESRGQLAAAVDSYREAVKLEPDDAESQARLGRILAKAERHPESEASFREAVRLRPDGAAHWKHLGSALEAQGKSAEAESAYSTALAIAPHDPEILNNLGVALASQNKLPEAESYYRRALEFAPKMAMVHNNLGHNLRMQDRLDEAEASLNEAIRLQPNYAEARNNLGIVHIQSRRATEGLASYEEALKIRPDYPEAHLNRALCWLTAGDFARGWSEYEWRFKLRTRGPASPLPRWDGTPLDGRTLLLLSEQGLGDTVQFVRYAALIPRGRGGTVALDCQEPLAELARTCPGIDRVIPRGSPIPDADVSISLLSLPYLFGTEESTIPAAVPYFASDPTRVAHWRAEVEALPGRRVGIAWQGSRDHKGDRARSVPLARFRALADVPGIHLCSLQKGYGSEQLTDGSAEGLSVADFGARTQSGFADAAALLRTLDLVITVDTSLAHVAGAVGVPVWVLVPFAPDWRWMHDREDTPWYPTMRLFRQPRRGDWDGVFARVAIALQQWPDRLRTALR